MTWVVVVLVVAGVAAVLFRVSVLAADVHDLWKFVRLRLERIEEDQRNSMVTLRLDLRLPARSTYCGTCQEATAGDPRKHQPWCPLSHQAWVRNYREAHPGEPLPEGAEDPDEQQQQGHRGVPEDPA